LAANIRPSLIKYLAYTSSLQNLRLKVRFPSQMHQVFQPTNFLAEIFTRVGADQTWDCRPSNWIEVTERREAGAGHE